MSTTLTLVNHKTLETIYELSIYDIVKQIWGYNVTDLTIVIRVGNISEVFDWDTVYHGNGVSLSIFQSALEMKILGMENKYNKAGE